MILAAAAWSGAVAETNGAATPSPHKRPVPPTVAAPAQAAAPSEPERPVPPGKYYVGRVTGERDYTALANATTPGFLVMRAEVTQGELNALTAWGTLHGYTFEPPCRRCDRSHDAFAAAGVSWRDAALLANAMSEKAGLDAVYRDAAGQPVRDAAAMDGAVVEPTLAGYRLPTIPEWQIALRGADKALAAGRYGTTGRSPNALGLVDGAGPLMEWTASSMQGEDGRRGYFACNGMAEGQRSLSACDLHPAGWSGPLVGFRLVRRLPAAIMPQERGPAPAR